MIAMLRRLEGDVTGSQSTTNVFSDGSHCLSAPPMPGKRFDRRNQSAKAERLVDVRSPQSGPSSLRGIGILRQSPRDMSYPAARHPSVKPTVDCLVVRVELEPTAT